MIHIEWDTKKNDIKDVNKDSKEVEFKRTMEPVSTDYNVESLCHTLS